MPRAMLAFLGKKDFFVNLFAISGNTFFLKNLLSFFRAQQPETGFSFKKRRRGKKGAFGAKGKTCPNILPKYATGAVGYWGAIFRNKKDSVLPYGIRHSYNAHLSGKLRFY